MRILLLARNGAEDGSAGATEICSVSSVTARVQGGSWRLVQGIKILFTSRSLQKFNKNDKEQDEVWCKKTKTSRNAIFGGVGNKRTGSRSKNCDGSTRNKPCENLVGWHRSTFVRFSSFIQRRCVGRIQLAPQAFNPVSFYELADTETIFASINHKSNAWQVFTKQAWSPKKCLCQPQRQKQLCTRVSPSPRKMFNGCKILRLI